jgi:GxxExxY protein
MENFYLKEETYEIIGLCMEVHKILGKGFNEIIYKEALQYEFIKKKIPFEREKEYIVEYKDIILSKRYFADFVVFDEIILEIKAISQLTSSDIGQTINYLACSKNNIGLVINFGEDSLKYRRVVL